jgi:hypothetical protein
MVPATASQPAQQNLPAPTTGSPQWKQALSDMRR